MAIRGGRDDQQAQGDFPGTALPVDLGDFFNAERAPLATTGNALLFQDFL